MAVIHHRPTRILYQCAKFGDDGTLFNVIIYVYHVYHAKVYSDSYDICP